MFFLFLYSPKMFPQGLLSLILSLPERVSLYLSAFIIALGEASVPQLLFLWSTFPLWLYLRSSLCLWHESSRTTMCQSVDCFLLSCLGFVVIPNLENSQPLLFRYGPYPFSVLSLSGTLLRSMFDFSLLYTLLFLRPLSMGIPGDWRMFLQREYLHLLLPSARGAFHSGLPWTSFSLISPSALWYKERVWIQSPPLRGNQPEVTRIWKRFSISQGPRQRQTSVLVCAPVKQSLSSHWGGSMRGSLLLQLSTCPNKARKHGRGKRSWKPRTPWGQLLPPQPLFPHSQPFSTVPRVLNFGNILCSVLRCCLLICLSWSRKVFTTSRNGSQHLHIYKSPLWGIYQFLTLTF